jgi:hypothetical protein
MRTVIMLVALLGSMEPVVADGATDAQTLAVSWDLLRDAGYGQSTKERSAFLVTGADGELALVKWPYQATSMRASYRGAIPAGTVAIVHTHPNTVPNPSLGDAALARKLNLPVYVLTRSSVTRTDGRRIQLVVAGDWNPSRARASR